MRNWNIPMSAMKVSKFESLFARKAQKLPVFKGLSDFLGVQLRWSHEITNKLRDGDKNKDCRSGEKFLKSVISCDISRKYKRKPIPTVRLKTFPSWRPWCTSNLQKFQNGTIFFHISLIFLQSDHWTKSSKFSKILLFFWHFFFFSSMGPLN